MTTLARPLSAGRTMMDSSSFRLLSASRISFVMLGSGDSTCWRIPLTALLTTLRSQLVRSKDAVDSAKQDGVVYRIPFECDKVYIRQTGRPMQDRIKEHDRDIRHSTRPYRDRDSGIEITEAWMLTIKRSRDWMNSKDRNAPIRAVEKQLITAKHQAL